MARIIGVEQLKTRLLKAAAKVAGIKPVVVGFTAEYALIVHEDLEAHHATGQAKFLEQPARELAPELGRMIKELVGKGVPLQQAIYLAGLRLQAESQKLVPVDTGNLKGSAFTEIEG